MLSTFSGCAWLAWHSGGLAGPLLAVLAAGTWLVVDITAGHVYSHSAIAWWNASVRLGFLAICALLLTRLRALLAQAATRAEVDGLTGVLNARAFRERLSYLLQLAGRHGHQTALVYIDVDDFKKINDTQGHVRGDAVLRQTAVTLQDTVRSSDVVGRLGGDEFVVLLPETPTEKAARVVGNVREHLLELARQNRWPVTFSIGVGVFPPGPITAEQAIKQADDLMYRVKNGGKDGILMEEYPIRGAL